MALEQDLKDLDTEIMTERRALKAMFDEKDENGKSKMTVDRVAEVNTRNDELGKKVEKRNALADALKLQRENDEQIRAFERQATGNSGKHSGSRRGEEERRDGGGDQAPQLRSFGKAFVESRSYKEFRGNSGPTDTLEGVEVRTLMSTSAGYAPEIVRNRPDLLSAQRRVVITDLIPVRPTTQPGLKYMEETLVTNAAAERAESVQGTDSSYAEAALAWTEKDSNARMIGVFMPITREQLQDVPYMMEYVDGRLGWMLNQRLESQILHGNGSAPNLKGLYTLGSDMEQLNQGGDDILDALHKLVTNMEVATYVMPNIAIFHPRKWEEIRLMRTADGIYIFGRPDEAGPTNIWGLTPAKSPIVTEAKPLVADSTFLELAPYTSVETEVSNSHSDYFVKGKLAIRADFRIAFHCYRPKAVGELNTAA